MKNEGFKDEFIFTIHNKKSLAKFKKKLKINRNLVFATKFQRSQLFETRNNVRLSNLSLKYQMSTPSGCKDIYEISSWQGIKSFYLKEHYFNIINLFQLRVVDKTNNDILVNLFPVRFTQG